MKAGGQFCGNRRLNKLIFAAHTNFQIEWSVENGVLLGRHISRKKLVFVILVGVFSGALSWASAGVVSDRFEPFDSETGFYFSQSILSIFAIYAGYKLGIGALLIYLIGAHVGLNLYAFIVGGAEQRAWALLLVFTTIFLLIFPLIFGLTGKLIYVIQKKSNKSRG